MHEHGYMKDSPVLSMPVSAGLQIAYERIEIMAIRQPEAASPQWNSQLYSSDFMNTLRVQEPGPFANQACLVWSS